MNIMTKNRTKEDYEKLLFEQFKVTRILAKRCKSKEREIKELKEEMRHLRGIIRNRKLNNQNH